MTYNINGELVRVYLLSPAFKQRKRTLNHTTLLDTLGTLHASMIA